jgi:O-antigen ligase
MSGTAVPSYVFVPAVGGLAVLLGWAIGQFPATISLTLVGALFAAVIWLCFPESAIYVLALVCPFHISYQIFGLRDVRPVQDVLLMVLIVTCIAAIPTAWDRGSRFKSPIVRGLMILWVFLAFWESLAFMLGPGNQYMIQRFLTNAWHLYKHVFRVMLPLPILIYCIANRETGRRVMNLVLFISVIVAAYGILESRQSGENPIGTFQGKNAFAGFMVLVIPLLTARMIFARGWWPRILHAGAVLILLRGLLLAGSRGGYVSFVASLLPLAILIPRRRLVAVGAAVFVGFMLVVAAVDNPLERPHVRRLLSLQNPTEVRSLEWRTEQWAFFVDRLKERPWLGTGSMVDESMEELGRATTAHSGYLSAATRAGIPAVIAWVVLLVTMGLVATRHSMTATTAQDRAFWIGMVGLLVALLTHNVVESTLQMPQVQQLLSIVLAVAVVNSVEVSFPPRRPAVATEELCKT